jgi:pimeloyl-ACP methyl ester carboxylesterase
MAVEDHGTGLPVVLLHAFPLDHRMWRHSTEILGDDFRLITPDMRGFGKSDTTQGEVTMEQFADDLHTLLAAMKIDTPIALCGLSMGGYIALEFARKYSDRLAGLILCDTRAEPDAPEKAENRRTIAAKLPSRGVREMVENMIPNLFCEDSLKNHAEMVTAARDRMLEQDPHGVAAAARGMAARRDSTDLLPTIGCPTLVVCGENDSITPPDEMRRMSEKIPNATFEIIPMASHLSPLESPIELNRALLRFLKPLTPGEIS